jgi:hypothetical protein
VGALVVHATLVVRGGSDPHKLFGFRPFNESDTWSAEIVSVSRDGTRSPVDPQTWDALVGSRKLRSIDHSRHAAAGADASVDFLDRALDWAVSQLPESSEVESFEATVTVNRNTRGPEIITLTSTD